MENKASRSQRVSGQMTVVDFVFIIELHDLWLAARSSVYSEFSNTNAIRCLFRISLFVTTLAVVFHKQSCLIS